MFVVVTLTGCIPQQEKQVESKVQFKQLQVAVINQDKVWTESEAAQEYQSKLNKQIKELQQDFQQRAKDLAADKRAQKHQEVYQKINQLREELKQKFKSEIKGVVEKIASNKEYDVVLNKQEVKYGGTDITSQVIKRLDQKE